MFDNWEFLKVSFGGNTVQDYSVSLAIFIGAIILLIIFKNVVFRRLQTLAKTTITEIDDLVLQILRNTVIPLLYLGAVYLALLQLSLPPDVDHALTGGFKIIVIIQFVRLILAILIP